MKDISLASIAFVVAAVAGAVVTITNPATLAFQDYIQALLVGAGLLGIGRGLDNGSGSKP